MSSADPIVDLAGKVAAEVKAEMLMQGVTQSLLAHRLGVTTAYVSAVLSGRKGIRAVVRVAEHIGLRISLSASVTKH